jgi:glucokinase
VIILRFKDGYCAAIDLGATNIRVALGLKNGNLLGKSTDLTDTTSGPDAISRQIASMIKFLQTELDLIHEELKGIGVGSIGPLDLKKGGVNKPANIPQYSFIPLVEPLETKFKVRVHLLNDCVASVVGERFFGLGTSEENLVYVTISTGIGGGVYVDGHLLIGKDGNAHEVGHMVIDSRGRLQCGCGKRGHWEAYSSGRNLPNYARLLIAEGAGNFEESMLNNYAHGDVYKITAANIFEAACKGDKLCLTIVEEVGKINAMGFANITNLYDPSLITVGGSVAQSNRELVLNHIVRRLDEYTINKPPRVVLTPLGGDIGLYGALAVAFSLHEDE